MDNQQPNRQEGLPLDWDNQNQEATHHQEPSNPPANRPILLQPGGQLPAEAPQVAGHVKPAPVQRLHQTPPAQFTPLDASPAEASHVPPTHTQGFEPPPTASSLDTTEDDFAPRRRRRVNPNEMTQPMSMDPEAFSAPAPAPSESETPMPAAQPPQTLYAQPTPEPQAQQAPTQWQQPAQPEPQNEERPRHHQQIFDPTFAAARSQSRPEGSNTTPTSSQQFIRTAHPIPDDQVATNPHSIGNKLRRARENAHLSILEVADNLKIRKDLIEALEQNHYEVLPAPVYTRAYIRKLTELFQADTEEFVQDYDQMLLSTRKATPVVKTETGPKFIDEDEDYEPILPAKPLFKKSSRRRPKLRQVMAVVITLAVAAATLSLLTTSSDTEASSSEPIYTAQQLLELAPKVEPNLKRLPLRN